MTNKPLVSIIIPTYNSEKYLRQCLKSVFNQSYENYEVIVIDNEKTRDNTRDIANSFGVKLYITGLERSSQMNFAAKKARGKYIVFVGSDYILNKDYIKKAVEKSEKEDFDAIYLNTISWNNSFWGKVKGLERMSYIGDNTIECAYFFKKSVFKKLKGFDENLVACEDYDMQSRLDSSGYKTGRINILNKHLGEATSLIEIMKKSYYYGKYMLPYFRKHPDGVKKMFPLRKAFFKNYKLFVKHPILSLGLFVFKFTQYSSALFGFLISLLKKQEVGH